MFLLNRAGLAALAGWAALGSVALGSSFDRESVLAGKTLSTFQVVYIAPVAVDLAPERGDRPVRDEDADARAGALHDRLRDAFSDGFAIASAPGPGVLAIEATLTRLQSSRPTMADMQDEPALSFESVFAGGAGFSARLSENDETLAEVSDFYRGSFSDAVGRVAIWEDADRAFWRWARQLLEFVEEN